ncbi:flagellar protein FlaG [Marinobacter mobilis]|uniref:flagellar protein FlaG n=1 Tax=Marinobacter mobilis TaxID=488533 RepID=UPI0035C75940
MTDVNLNNPDLRLVSTRESAPVRATASPLADGRGAPAQGAVGSSSISAAEAVPGQSVEASREVKQSQLDNAVSKLNDFVQTVQRDLQFEVDNDLGQTIVRVVDQQTQEVIRQMPDEVALRLAEKLQQDEPLTLFNLKV